MTADRRITISNIGDYRFGVPTAVTLPFGHFVQLLTYSQESTDKFRVPCWSPAVFSRPERTASAVAHVSALVLDIDEPADIPGVVEGLEKRGLEYIFHSTYSGGGRAILPLASPVMAPTWKAFHAAAFAWLGVKASADPTCSDPCRQYFAPCHRPGATHGEWYQPGLALDPAAVPQVAAPDPVGYLPVSRAAMERLAKKWANKMHPLADALRSLLDGEAYAQQGQRDVVTFQLAKDLAKAFPQADPVDLASFFDASRSLMGVDAPDPLPKLEKALAAPEAQPPATYDEIQALAAQHGPLERRWIIQRGNAYWLLTPGGYRGPYTKDDAGSAAVRDLAPAVAAGLSLHAITPQGQTRRKTLSELVDQYGSVAESVRLSYREPFSRYDEATRTMVEAPCKPVVVTAAFHPGVGEWLNLLFGAKVERGLAWLAAVKALDRPLAALLLTGAPGAGKSLLAAGVAGLWGPQWADLEGIMSPFSGDAYMTSPVAVADETLPKDNRGFQRTAELRRIIQEPSRLVRRKYLPDAVLEGCLRVMVMANSQDILSLQEHLEMADIQAITERFLHIDVPASAARFLEMERGRKLPGDRDALRQAVTCHVQWLVENYRFQARGRFIVTDGADDELFRKLAVRGGPRSAVLRWVVGFVLRPELLLRSAREPLARVAPGPEVWVSLQAIESHWSLYGNEMPMRLGAIASALSSVAPRKVRRDGVTYRVVDMANIEAWCVQTGFTEPETIRAALARALDTQPASVLVN